jgi:hypothetical protein
MGRHLSAAAALAQVYAPPPRSPSPAKQPQQAAEPGRDQAGKSPSPSKRAAAAAAAVDMRRWAARPQGGGTVAVQHAGAPPPLRLVPVRSSPPANSRCPPHPPTHLPNTQARRRPFADRPAQHPATVTATATA